MQNKNGITQRFLFYMLDLNFAHYKNTDNTSQSLVYSSTNNEFNHFICYVSSGELTLLSNNTSKTLKANDFVVFKPKQKFEIRTIPNVDAYYCIICFSSKLFNLDEATLLRIFNYTSDENNIYNANDMRNTSLVKNLIELSVSYMNNNLNKAHLISVLKLLVSELCVEYDKTHPNDIAKYSDEYKLRIYDYICQNFWNKITLEDVANKFFVSKWYVNSVCYQFYNLPFKQTMIDMRMWYARGLIIQNPYVNALNISQACGYKEYSAFFKTYLKYFGVSPKEDLEKYKKTHNFN